MDLTIVIIIAVLVILALLLFKLEHQGKRIKLFLIIVVVLLIASSIFSFSRSNVSSMNNPRGVLQTGFSYIGWVGKSIANLWDAKDEIGNLVGNAVSTNNTNLGRG